MVTDLAALVDPTLRGWLRDHVDFATSMVDRITPATTDEDRALVTRARRATSTPSRCPPSRSASGSSPARFPAGRPRWEDAGATLVDDVRPFEQRKLWLLNGSHSLLAYAGSIRGHATIDEAVADPACRAEVEAFWDEAARTWSSAGDAVAGYRAALLDRFANPRVRHRLAQIAGDGSTKLRVRILPPLRAERAAGRLPVGCASTLAAWVLHLRGHGAPVNDPGADAARSAATARRPRDGRARGAGHPGARAGRRRRPRRRWSARGAALLVPDA